MVNYGLQDGTYSTADFTDRAYFLKIWLQFGTIFGILGQEAQDIFAATIYPSCGCLIRVSSWLWFTFLLQVIVG